MKTHSGSSNAAHFCKMFLYTILHMHIYTKLVATAHKNRNHFPLPTTTIYEKKKKKQPAATRELSKKQFQIIPRNENFLLLLQTPN